MIKPGFYLREKQLSTNKIEQKLRYARAKIGNRSLSLVSTRSSGNNYLKKFCENEKIFTHFSEIIFVTDAFFWERANRKISIWYILYTLYIYAYFYEG